jgi:hypothetical protein
MTAGRPSRGGRAASCRAAVSALVGLGVLVGGASGAFAQNQPQPTTTTTAPTTTTTRPRATTTTSPPTTAPPTTQETAPPATAEPPPPPDNDSDVEPVVDEEQPVEEEAAAETYDGQGITFTTVANLLVPGDGTEGAQATTTTTAPQPDEGSSADDENRLIWMIIAGLGAVAVLVAVLTWRYWLLTRPGLVLEGEEAEDVRRGGAGPGYGNAAPPGRTSPPGGRGGNDAFWDEPRDPRRAFVGPPDAGGAPSRPPGSGAPNPGRQGSGTGPEGARRRRGGPSGPGDPGGSGAPGGPGGSGGQAGRGGPRSGRSAWPPGSPGEGEPKRRRWNPGAGPPPGSGGSQAAGKRRRGQPGAGSAGWANDMGPGGARRAVGHVSGGGRMPPPARPQPLAGRSMRDTDIWAPDRRR